MIKTIWNAGTPRRLDQLQNHTFSVNQMFESEKKLKLALCEHAEAKDRRHKSGNLESFNFFGRDTDTLYRVRCVEECCPLQFEASKTDVVGIVRVFQFALL